MKPGTCCLLDLDGTVLKGRLIDDKYIHKLLDSYDHVLITSNNSSVSHGSLQSRLVTTSAITLITPQLIAKEIIRLHRSRYDLISTFEVCSFLHTQYKQSPILLEAIERSIHEYFYNYLSQHLLFIGKTRCNKSYVTSGSDDSRKKVILMNSDKAKDSHLDESHSKLLGDIYQSSHTLCKTTPIYIYVIKEYLRVLKMCPTIVIGDNPSTDGVLASLLDIQYKSRCFDRDYSLE